MVTYWILTQTFTDKYLTLWKMNEIINFMSTSIDWSSITAGLTFVVPSRWQKCQTSMMSQCLKPQKHCTRKTFSNLPSLMERKNISPAVTNVHWKGQYIKYVTNAFLMQLQAMNICVIALSNIIINLQRWTIFV